MEIVPIKTKRDYRRTLKEIEGLMTARRGTPEGDRLDVLVTLIDDQPAAVRRQRRRRTKHCLVSFTDLL